MAITNKQAVITPRTTAAIPTVALAQVANTISRPGVLTTEWWTLVISAVASATIGLVGVSSNTAAQFAGTIAPVAVALIYALVRAHTKGALADVLQAAFPAAIGANAQAQQANAQAQQDNAQGQQANAQGAQPIASLSPLEPLPQPQ
jgi:hypothetical protein